MLTAIKALSFLKKIFLFCWQPMEEGVTTPSFHSFSLTFPLNFSATFLTSKEVLSASFMVLSASLEVLSLSRSTINPSPTSSRSISAFLRLHPPQIRNLLEDFGFYFLKIRSVIFRKHKLHTRPSTVSLGLSTSSRHLLCHHLTTTHRWVLCP